MRRVQSSVGTILREAALPGLDFAARWCMAKSAALEGEHSTAAQILDALRLQIDEERDRRPGGSG